MPRVPSQDKPDAPKPGRTEDPKPEKPEPQDQLPQLLDKLAEAEEQIATLKGENSRLGRELKAAQETAAKMRGRVALAKQDGVQVVLRRPMLVNGEQCPMGYALG